MRIISGRLKGKQFDSPHSRRTHPMSDRVRGALFNALGDLDGLSVLDPFAGTGALGFEAVSRGAAAVVAVEIDRAAQKIVEQNIASLGLTSVELVRGNVRAWLRRNPDRRFDIILCDPPYDDIDPLLLRSLATHLTPDGVFVLSWPGREKTINIPGLAELQHKKYGDAELIFLRRRG